VDIYASDDEKGEEIKRWWRENGRSVVIAVIVGLVAMFGGRHWIQSQKDAADKASMLYQSVVTQVTAGDSNAASEQAQLLFDDFAKTPYAAFAAFEMTSSSIEAGQVEKAKEYLQWIMANANLSVHREIARYRLAKVLLDEGSFNEARELINSSDNQALQSLFVELAGDIYQAEGSEVEARAAYQTTLLTLSQNEPRYALVKLKLDDLAISDAN